MPLRPQSGNGENVDVMGGGVAAEGRRRSDNGENSGLGLRAAGLEATFSRKRSIFLTPSGTLASPSLISNAAQRPSRSSTALKAKSSLCRRSSTNAGDTPGLFGSICDHNLTSLSEVGILYFRGISNSIFEDFRTSFLKYNPVNSSGIVAEIETAVEEGPINQIEPPHHFLDTRNGEALDACDPCQVFGHA